jgi:hypothetical protein
LLFFRQAISLIPMFPMTMFERVGPVVLRILKPCITSEHFQVALNAALFCSAPEFMALFRSIPDEVTTFLLSAARTATAHWNPEAREVAEFLVDAIREFETESKVTERGRTAKNPRPKGRIGWLEVVDIAADMDAELDREREKTKAETWLRQIRPCTGTL